MLTNHYFTVRSGRGGGRRGGGERGRERLMFYITIKFCFVPLDENQIPINQTPQSNYYILKYTLNLHFNWKISYCYNF